MHWTLLQQKLFSGGLGKTSEYTLCNLKICRISYPFWKSILKSKPNKGQASINRSNTGMHSNDSVILGINLPILWGNNKNSKDPLNNLFFPLKQMFVRVCNAGELVRCVHDVMVTRRCDSCIDSGYAVRFEIQTNSTPDTQQPTKYIATEFRCWGNFNRPGESIFHVKAGNFL